MSWSVSSTVVNVNPCTCPSSLRDNHVCITAGVITLVLAFPSMESPSERKERVVVIEETTKTVLKSEKGCFEKEEPHSSLLCLFVLLLVVHRLVFPMPLLSVGGASLQMGNTMVVIHHSTMLCVLCFDGQES